MGKIFPATTLTLILVTLFTCGWVTTTAQPTDRPPYLNDSLDPGTRAADLLSRLTPDEKISLLQYTQPAIDRLGIPAYTWWNEALHGVARNGFATVFPQAIGMAATWDPGLIGLEGEAVSHEARVKYDRTMKNKGFTGIYEGLTFWSPNINIFRDPRWGRGQETFGEDPFLTSVVGAAYVRGLQGDDPVYLRAAAAAKHFAVHSGPEHNRHSFNAVVTDRDLYETYLPAFEHLVKFADVEAVMCAYNRLDGRPCCANDFLLTGLLRTRWGFRGHVVTDCWAISDMINGHGTYSSETEAAAASIRAGTDISCGPEMGAISEALHAGLIDTAHVDRAVFRLLLTRVRLGMFNDRNSHPFFHVDSSLLNSPAHDSLSHLVAAGGMVLLENKNGILPLSRAARKIGVVGPIAADTVVLLGNYNGTPVRPVTFLWGIQEIVSGVTRLVYTPGYEKAWGRHAAASPATDTAGSMPAEPGRKFHPDLVSGALTDLAGVDTVIFFAGISAALEGEEGDTENQTDGFFRGDRTSLRLPDEQRYLIGKLREAGKKIILVVTSGGAVSLEGERGLAEAVIMAWYPGQRGGSALASLLFGLENPSGRLPVTVYRSVTDLPDYEDYSMEGRTYRYFRGDPLYEFGYGLGYTEFSYANLRMSPDALSTGDTLTVSVDVTNTGARDGQEVVQAYLRKPGDGYTVKSLCAFEKVPVRSGRTVTVRLTVFPDQMRMYDGGDMIIRGGEYRLEVGRSSRDIRLNTSFSVFSQKDR